MVAYAAHDRALAEECILRLPDGVDVKFQFPPKLLSDNRSGNWNEGELPGTEPVAVFKNSGPREMTLSWTYIVDGAQWTTEVIANEIKRVRGYFANVLDAKDAQRSLICYFKYGLYGDQSVFSSRIKRIDVKHGDSMILPVVIRPPFTDARGIINTTQAFPLRSDVTIDLRLWTAGMADQKKQDIKQLKNNQYFEWY